MERQLKVYLDMVGCRLNQAEIEGYARQFQAAGHSLARNLDEADLLVLNTCAVTAAAARDSRKKIRQAHRAGVSEIVVTGCMSTLLPDETAAMRGVTRVVPNPDKDRLVADLLGIEIPEFELEPIERERLPGERGRTRAFIKVQDGCDNKCTFCITTVARGVGRSRNIAAVIAEVQNAIWGGAQEVVLTGVHLGSWGQDLEIQLHLSELIQAILKDTDVARLRVSSLEPWDLEAEFFDLWQDPRLCAHLHLPLQSGSTGTLKRMARKTSPKQFSALVAAARERIPDVAITTDIICGFPGESDREFGQTREFVEKMDFAGAHIFTYSEREGTAAATMAKPVPHFLRKARSAVLREITEASAAQFRAIYIGRDRDVLWESIRLDAAGGWLANGLTDNNLRVRATAAYPVWNQVTPTLLTSSAGDLLDGQILSYPDTILLDVV
jgi:threonylcarbamoyladenosine tRNA methylthiotransferase MtaB